MTELVAVLENIGLKISFLIGYLFVSCVVLTIRDYSRNKELNRIGDKVGELEGQLREINHAVTCVSLEINGLDDKD